MCVMGLECLACDGSVEVFVEVIYLVVELSVLVCMYVCCLSHCVVV